MKWISVKDKLPDIVGNYLIYAPTYIHSHNGITVAHFSRGKWKVNTIPLKHGVVTHWQELPELP